MSESRAIEDALLISQADTPRPIAMGMQVRNDVLAAVDGRRLIDA